LIKAFYRVLAVLPIIIVASAVSACKTVPDEASSSTVRYTGNYKVGKPYQVAGVWYYPKEDFDYDRTGLASWYGDDFAGRKTANGERFNPGLMTAAHKTLPMPVMAKVTNLENGKQIVVRINDRGPFVQGRIIDLSRQAAKKLGFKESGVAKVRVQYIGKAIKETSIVKRAVTDPRERTVSGTAPVNEVASDELAPPPGAMVARELPSPENRPRSASDFDSDFRQVAVNSPANMYVQAGSFQMRDNAIRLKSSLERSGYKMTGVEIRTALVNGLQYYRVQIGPILMVESADQMLAKVLDSGYAGARIVIN
jgi:peptidoglycan lytic transglycosylase